MFVSLWYSHSTWFRNAISLKLVVGTYGGSHSRVQWKNHPTSFPRTFFLEHTFLTSTMKSSQNAILLSNETIFFHPPEVVLSQSVHSDDKWIYFPKKERRIKSKFQMVNLCNDGTKDFAELWVIPAKFNKSLESMFSNLLQTSTI